MMISRVLLPLLLLFALLPVACADTAPQARPEVSAPHSAPVADDPAATITASDKAADATDPSSAAEVDYSCTVDSDCEVKNVGNCCGYYPACVNTDSPTFPEQVQAKCQAEGLMSVCGFPSISGCQCIEGRCSNITGPGAGSGIEELR